MSTARWIAPPWPWIDASCGFVNAWTASTDMAPLTSAKRPAVTNTPPMTLMRKMPRVNSAITTSVTATAINALRVIEKPIAPTPSTTDRARDPAGDRAPRGEEDRCRDRDRDTE